MSNELQAIFQEALAKFVAGEAKHGPFIPATDSRNLLLEAEDELLDAINYLAMGLIKVRRMGLQGRVCPLCGRSPAAECSGIAQGAIVDPGASSKAGRG